MIGERLFTQYDKITQKQIRENIVEIASGKTKGTRFGLPYDPVQRKNLESTNVCGLYDTFTRKHFLHIL